MQLAAKLCEIHAVHSDFRRVVSFRNSEMFAVECYEIEAELCALFLTLVVKNDVE